MLHLVHVDDFQDLSVVSQSHAVSLPRFVHEGLGARHMADDSTFLGHKWSRGQVFLLVEDLVGLYRFRLLILFDRNVCIQVRLLQRLLTIELDWLLLCCTHFKSEL